MEKQVEKQVEKPLKNMKYSEMHKKRGGFSIERATKKIDEQR